MKNQMDLLDILRGRFSKFPVVCILSLCTVSCVTGGRLSEQGATVSLSTYEDLPLETASDPSTRDANAPAQMAGKFRFRGYMLPWFDHNGFTFFLVRSGATSDGQCFQDENRSEGRLVVAVKSKSLRNQNLPDVQFLAHEVEFDGILLKKFGGIPNTSLELLTWDYEFRDVKSIKFTGRTCR